MRRRLLLWSQLALQPNVEWPAGEAFVAQLNLDRQIGKQVLHRLEAPTRQGEMLRVVFRTSDNARLVVRRETHGLRLVELRVLKRRNPQKSIP